MYLYYKIPGRAISKKNSLRMVLNRKTFKIMPIQSEAWKKYEKHAKQYLKPLRDPIDFPVNIKVTYWIHKNKDGSMPKTKLDLTNLLAGTDDLLVKYRILDDDDSRTLMGHDGSRVYYTSIGEEYTEIEIQSFIINEEVSDRDH